MQIGVIGATGGIGSRVVSEALRRGHRVTALSRDVTRREDDRDRIVWKRVDVLDAGGIPAVLPSLDVLISGFQPGNAGVDFQDAIERSIANPTVYARAGRALLEALNTHPRTRLILIGGAASLEIEPGLTTADSDELIHASLDRLGLPRAYGAAVRGHRDPLNVLRTSNRLWMYFSPAEQTLPGERTGRFRIGGDQARRGGRARGFSRSAPDAGRAGRARGVSHGLSGRCWTHDGHDPDRRPCWGRSASCCPSSPERLAA